MGPFLASGLPSFPHAFLSVGPTLGIASVRRLRRPPGSLGFPHAFLSVGPTLGITSVRRLRRPPDFPRVPPRIPAKQNKKGRLLGRPRVYLNPFRSHRGKLEVSGFGLDAEASEALSLQSAGCVRVLPQNSVRLLRACVPFHPRGRSAS